MERIYLKELNTNFSAYDGKEVTVAGWAKTIRDSKAFGFIELNDARHHRATFVLLRRDCKGKRRLFPDCQRDCGLHAGKQTTL